MSKQKSLFVAAAVAEAKAAQPPAEGLDPAGDLFARLVDESWSSLCERSDRTSPAEHPEMCLITRDELAEFIETARLTGGLTVAAAMPEEGGQAVSYPEPGPGHVWFSQASRDVLAERRRQVEAEGFAYELDDERGNGSLILAAVSYATNAAVRVQLVQQGMPADVIDQNSASAGVPRTWPWQASWWKPAGGTRRILVKAAALLIAEIERLDRKEARHGE